MIGHTEARRAELIAKKPRTGKLLTRGDVVGYDIACMSYKFTMMNGTDVVACEISNVALNHFSGGRPGARDRDAQFLKLRSMIEKLAVIRFKDNNSGPVRIFAKHLPPIAKLSFLVRHTSMVSGSKSKKLHGLVIPSAASSETGLEVRACHDLLTGDSGGLPR
jgi:hypothetical protein